MNDNATFLSSELPKYQVVVDSLRVLDLPMSASELHGMMCGYISCGALKEGEEFLRALVPQKRDKSMRKALLALFEVYAFSQQQIMQFDFAFQLLLPDHEVSLRDRAQIFGEWCEGFVQGLNQVGVDTEKLNEEEAQDALEHIKEFAHLDYEGLSVHEEDERALMEVSEYTRMAVLRIYEDLHDSQVSGKAPRTAH